MKLFKTITFCWMIIFFLQAKTVLADNLRIEQEDKLFVPQEKVEEVWQWLQANYIDNQESVKNINPLITVKSSLEKFKDVYYDTPKLELLNKQNSTRYRQRENITNPEDIKSGRELVQIKLSNISDNQLNRGEYKFDVNSNQSTSSVLNLIKPSQKNEYINKLGEIGINAQLLKPILTINDSRRRIYFDRENKSFISISLDQASVSKWWLKLKFSEIEPELNEVTYTENDEAGRVYMEEVNQQIISEVKTQFPEISSDLTPKYNKAFNGLEGKIPFFRWMIKLGII